MYPFTSNSDVCYSLIFLGLCLFCFGRYVHHYTVLSEILGVIFTEAREPESHFLHSNIAQLLILLIVSIDEW